MSERSKKAAVTVYEWLDAFVFALVAVTILFVYIFKVYTVTGSSMVPTLHTSDRVFAWCLGYEPKQGDVVIVDTELVIGESIVKRVVATGGQVVDIDQETGAITVDGVLFDTPIATTTSNISGNLQFPVRVPENCVFVMGDNRGNSHDSRYTTIGFVDSSSVIGQVHYIFASGENNGTVE